MVPFSFAPPRTRRCYRTGRADRDEGGVERGRDAVDHLETEVLVAGLDPVHGALTGAEHARELGLREAAVLARILIRAPIRSSEVSVT